MKFFDLKEALEAFTLEDEKGGSLKDRLGEITDNDSLNEFYKEWKKVLKKNLKAFHPDKNLNADEEKDLDNRQAFNDFREKTALISEYIDQFTTNDNGIRKFKDKDNQEAFSAFTKSIDSFAQNESQQSQSSARNSNGSHSSSFIFSEPSFDELAKTINWGEVFKPEPPIKPSWLASVDDSGNLVVINSEGKKDENSKILEKAMWHISEQNASVNDRFEISSETISGVIVIISNEEMKQKIAQNGGIKEDNKKDQESIIVPLDLDITSSRKMIGKHEEKSLEVAVVKSPQGSWTSRIESARIESKAKGEKGNESPPGR
jgi:hypothetical protein